MKSVTRLNAIGSGVLLTLFGGSLLVGGVELAVRGATVYYLVAGLVLIVSGVLYVLGRREGLWCYLLYFSATLLWSLAEAGLDGWRLMPRLLLPAFLLIWLSTPLVRNGLTFGRGGERIRMAGIGGAASGVATIVLVFATGDAVTASRHVRMGIVDATVAALPVGTSVPEGDWPFYGRDQAATRFSPLAQITPANVAALQPAWQFNTGDLPTEAERSSGPHYTFETTPTVVDGKAYVCTAHRQVFAIDATTGRRIWRYVPPGDSTRGTIALACRGVAYVRVAAAGICAERVIAATNDGRLFALDAVTGQPCRDFGHQGYIGLTERLGKTPAGFHYVSSQPLVTRGKVIVGGWVYDGGSVDEPSGVVRAYDVVTGAPAWSWDLGRTPATRPLGPGETFTRATPNMWATPSADERLGLVYLPLGVTTPDYYGANRRTFDDAYGTSVVALDISSGRERWRFQTVHHDLWDLDLGAGPSLVDLPDGRGGTLPAMLQPTKRGEIFLLDRRNGRPLAEVVERRVPKSDVPGEHSSPTQPFSTFPGVAPQGRLVGADMWGLTPIDQMMCRIGFARRRYEGAFTPPSLGAGSIGYPAFYGIVDWQGVTVDPTRHLMFTNTSYVPYTFRMMARSEAERKGVVKSWKGFGSGQPFPQNAPGWSGQYGTPYAIELAPFLGASGLPCTAPPWGTMVAIDYLKRKLVWERPVGDTRHPALLGAPLATGVNSMAGGIATASGLIFIGAFVDDVFRAVDARTGEVLWSARLPAGGQAIPATYLGRDGRQFVVVAAGGHGGVGTKLGDALVAYALPRR